MNTIRWAFVPLVAITASCAQPGTPSSPQASAEEQCFYLVRQERFQYVGIGKATPTSNGYNVEVRMRDTFDRPFTATCVYANGKASWAQPLPNNLRY